MSVVSAARYQAVIFDMDGLTLDTERLSYSVWQKVFPEYGFEFRESVYLQVLGRTVEDTERLFKNAYGEDFPYLEMRRKRISYVEEHIANNGVPLRDGLLDLINFLEANGIPKAIGTSTARKMALSKLKMAGIDSHFPILVGGDDVSAGKPDPAIFLKAAEKLKAAEGLDRLNITPDKCIVLEDSGAGIEAACRAGMLPILVPDLQIPTLETKRKAHAICSSLHEVKLLMPELLGLIEQRD